MINQNISYALGSCATKSSIITSSEIEELTNGKLFLTMPCVWVSEFYVFQKI